MAANPQDDLVNVEVDGVAVKGRKGAMIIHVTDAHGAYVPRFCYHDKLPVAANCRMCLVEVEKAPKPLPACATPIAEGMKIYTRSKAAISAQKATMEFLLINHPLDCPICDQGGECELQDLALGYGRDIARFSERKRIVKDKDLGPLVSTDMTRCIHCTRCVRFGQDVAGIQELGTTGRGEHMEIGTFVEKSVEHELSGNIIDLCPVGALNSKPFRYQGRSWEMSQAPLVSPHDGVGTNIFGHVLRGKLKRVVSRANDAVNETWIADRDRFSYEAVNAADRLTTPMIRTEAGWREASWDEALAAAARGLKAAGEQTGMLVHPSASTEEAYLAARIARSLGTAHVDHRLRQRDFRDAQSDPRAPSLGMPLEAVDTLSGLLVIGANLRSELPLLAHRVRKAVVRAGASVGFLDLAARPYLFPVAVQVAASADAWVAALAGIVAAAAQASGTTPSAALAPLLQEVKIDDAHRRAAAALGNGSRRAVWLGALAQRHSRYADLRALAGELAKLTGATLGLLAEGGNAAGAWLAGAVPHRAAAGAVTASGCDANSMLTRGLRAYVTVGAIESSDFVDGELANRAFGQAACVIALTPFDDPALRRHAHVLLPIGTFAETSGTFVNLEGRWQSFTAAAKAPGETRPGWKVLRVLGNLLDCDGFDYQSSEDVREELRRAVLAAGVEPTFVSAHTVESLQGAAVTDDVPMYAVDALVRRAPALQATIVARRSRGEVA
ncbi:MAG: hypothetical protein RL469_486 [Pseudomonadota bacterium]|jgi:NADH-quinone oxidoreductase subunit G|nr:NADH-quinone oxidoreductase subunit G [Gammaproteobacteria bacterium]